MSKTYFVKKHTLMTFLILGIFILLTGSADAEETENTPVPIHLNLKEAVKLCLKLVVI